MPLSWPPPPPQIDPAAELAALRARATALGATADTPDACLSEFEAFSGKALPTLEVGSRGIAVKNVGTTKGSYAGYFKAMWDTAAGVVRLQCLVGGGCKGKPVSFHVVGKSGEHTFPFANAYNHLLACPGRPFLLLEHFDKRNVVKEKETEAQGEKRGRILDEPLEHLCSIGGAGGTPTWRFLGRPPRCVFRAEPLSTFCQSWNSLNSLPLPTFHFLSTTHCRGGVGKINFPLFKGKNLKVEVVFR